MNNRWVLTFAMGAVLFADTVAAAEWRMDPAASRLGFTATYQGEAAPGHFKQFDTRLRFDPARPAGSSLQVKINMASVDMGGAEMDEGVRSAEWFDTPQFAEAEFRSTDIKRVAPDRYVARGELRVKGVQKPIDVPFTWKPEGKGASMAGDLTLNRGMFNVGTGEWATGDPIGLDVKVNFNVRLLPVS